LLSRAVFTRSIYPARASWTALAQSSGDNYAHVLAPMGQRLSATACCSCLLDCLDPQRTSKKPKLQQSPGSALSTASTASITADDDVQQPLVVEDESWKKWSSYNLIHNADGSRRGDDSNIQYHPPVFVSHTAQQDAEAVWDL
jgi:hypothetical protein